MLLQLPAVYGMTETSPVTNVDISQTPGCAGHMIANTLGKVGNIYMMQKPFNTEQ